VTEPAATEQDLPDDGAEDSGYDQIAGGYDRYWAPVLRPAAERVLDHLAAAVDGALEGGRDARLLDVGSGTGTLALAALRRWPALRVTAVDPSAGMLEVARGKAVADLEPDAAARFEPVVAYADELPADIGRFELAMSSFVLQLVPSRAAALREICDVLLPGATFAWVTWQRSDRPFEPDRVANAVLDDFGFDPPEPDRRPGDIASSRAAALGMRRAGFRDVRAWTDEVAYAWDAEGYLDFLTHFDEASLFDDLDAGERRRIEKQILDGLGRLSADELTLRLPIVYVVGKTPA
jgi:ubiquinone/menaquinone biosynthesis C-methylase UbiE